MTITVILTERESSLIIEELQKKREKRNTDCICIFINTGEGSQETDFKKTYCTDELKSMSVRFTFKIVIKILDSDEMIKSFLFIYIVI